jgi:diguanylate cyclase (GGDEF)-like protein
MKRRTEDEDDTPVVLSRHEFLKRLETSELAATETTRCALLLLDINDFQSINDAFGTDAGDRVLDIVGNRLLLGLGPHVVVGTLGGDRFGVLTAVKSKQDGLRLGRALLTVASTPIRVLSHDIAMTGRVGFCLLTDNRDATSSALRCTTAALRKAKGTSIVNAVTHCSPVADSSHPRSMIRREIGHVIDTERLRLAYQPIVALADGTIMGYEALIRWRAADGRDVPAELFVSVA